MTQLSVSSPWVSRWKWCLVLTCGGIAAASLIAGCGGAGTEKPETASSGPGQPPAATTAAPPAGKSKTRGEILFENNCAGCHAPNGEGGPAGKSLLNAHRLTPEAIATVIHDGQGMMPAFENNIAGEDLQQLIKHIRGLGHHDPETDATAPMAPAKPSSSHPAVLPKGDAEPPTR